MAAGDGSRVNYRRALEALRNGVPNRDAARELGCNQEDAERSFREKLDSLGDPSRENDALSGLLVQGGFGTGKSHLLEYFEHLALTENFVCSRVVISKETPLHSPEKVFRAAVEDGYVPNRSGHMIDEIATNLDSDSPGYAQFFQWANQDGNGISSLFPATLLIHERIDDPEVHQEIVRFWSGDPMPIAKVRRYLREIGQAQTYNVRTVRAPILAAQRFAFALRLIRGAGYRGWVILMDEIELISKYSVLQRGRSYAELARWMGRATDERYPGLVVVGTITDDFAVECLDGKHDRDNVGPRLRARGTDESNILAARAEAGMRLIERDSVPLARPDDSTLDRTYTKLKEIHSRAYDWTAPDVPSPAQAISRRMRSYVRRWINEWDLKRLYPDADVEIEEQEVRLTYDEDGTWERSRRVRPAKPIRCKQ